MALFQKTVEQKYLKQLDSALINAKYLEFKTHFGNTEIQENIRISKEEQYQEGFLRELFVKILGYKLSGRKKGRKYGYMTHHPATQQPLFRQLAATFL
jgi:hypothetical protein